MAREHLRAFSGLPGVIPAGICSRTPAKAAALATEFSLPEVAETIQTLYERSRADLVVVAVPELAARHVAEQCFAFPWKVLMEKPAGYNVQDASAILEAARKNKGQVYVGLNRRFMSSTQAALTDLNALDENRHIHVTDQQSLHQASVIGHPPEVVRNWMFANSIHVIDLLRCFGRGRIIQVQPFQPWRADAPGVVLAHVKFDSGDTGLYEGIWNGPGPWAASITTASKRWELRPLERASFLNVNERQWQEVIPDELDHTFKPGFRRQALEVLAALHGQPSKAVTLLEAFETMTLIQSIFGL